MNTTDPRSAATVAELILAAAHAYGDAPAVRLVSDDGTAVQAEITYRELEAASAERARGLLALGVGKGTRVGILFGNGPEWTLWWAAIDRIGAVCVPISTFLKPAELARVVRHADLHAIVGTRTFLRRDFVRIAAAAFPELSAATHPALAITEAPYLRWIAFDGDPSEPWVTSHRSIVAAGSADVWADILRAVEREVHPEDEALIIYTSGQSADPKGVVHTQGSVLEKVHYLAGMYGFPTGVVCEITLPFFWVGGLSMGLFPVLTVGGVTVCSARSTWGTGQIIGSAAAQDNPYAHLPKQAALGMTETFGIYSWSDDWRVPGYPLCAPIDELQPGFEVRLVDEEGRSVPDGEYGQILLRGPTLTRRLHKVSRSEVFDADGYYRTGDRAVVDAGRRHFTGRISDMIKTSGANVSSAEVERELNQVEGIEAAHVVGLDDPGRDQIVAAAVVLASGSTLTAADIRSQLSERLSSYKVPRRIVFLRSVEDVPMTPSMKVRRPELAALIAASEEPPTTVV